MILLCSLIIFFTILGIVLPNYSVKKSLKKNNSLKPRSDCKHYSKQPIVKQPVLNRVKPKVTESKTMVEEYKPKAEKPSEPKIEYINSNTKPSVSWRSDLKYLSKEYRGREGEERVYRELCKIFVKQNILRNVYIGSADKGVQIDFIAVNSSGIFIIEVKTLRGKTYIGPQNMTQYFEDSQYKYLSPIKQQISHINAFHYMMGYNEPLPVYSLIVFAGEGNFKCKSPQGHCICYLRDMCSNINVVPRKNNGIIVPIIVEQIKNRVKSYE